MIKATRIVLERAEYGPESKHDIHAEFNSGNIFDLASKRLSKWSETAPRDMGYHKTDFTVYYENGENYNGRVDLQHPNSRNRSTLDIAEHIREFALFYSGQKKPCHLTAEQYQSIVDKPHKAVLSQFLKEYQIGD